MRLNVMRFDSIYAVMQGLEKSAIGCKRLLVCIKKFHRRSSPLGTERTVIAFKALYIKVNLGGTADFRPKAKVFLFA